MMEFEELQLSQSKKAALVSVVCPKIEGHTNEQETGSSLNELKELLRTLGIKSGNSYIQNRKQLTAGTLIGRGKLEEIAKDAKENGHDLLVFDIELTASQVRNIKEITTLEVIDRVYVILEIFAQHAQTKEAKIQIEIAKLEYLLPRLSTLWSHFTRQKGGIGLKGEGEQQLELDKRLVREKIENYKKQLKNVEKSRIEQRKKRKNKAITAALVGYTNAGKSSLMNRMCKVNVLEENKLFATLDSTFRMLNPDTKPPMILIDTVGFISNLPNTLVTGFKSTLESAIEAELLIIVCDISDPQYKKHLKVTNEVLDELELGDKKKMIVFNKKDLVHDPHLIKIIQKQYPESFVISSNNKEDIQNLREHIVNYFLNMQESYDLFVPFEEGHAHSKIQANTNIVKTSNSETGIYYRIRVPDFIFAPLQLTRFILGPQEKIPEQI